MNDQLLAALTTLVEDGECYCADNVANRKPCGWCVAKATLTNAEWRKWLKDNHTNEMVWPFNAWVDWLDSQAKDRLTDYEDLAKRYEPV